ncbi:MAG: lysylphosphatidylglycerol synthase transmembrane domain-containing protein [Chloroflexota bacterium]
MAVTEPESTQPAKEWQEPEPAQERQELSIGKRVGSWKTAASFAFAALIIVFVIIKGGIDPTLLWNKIRTINVGLYLSAFVVYYLTFPLRGFRWKVLLENAYKGDPNNPIKNISTRGLTEIIYISWFVNCVVPAKLGDLYRAYLAKLWVQISWVKTIGTIVAERIIDILVLVLLMAITGFIVFRSKLGHLDVVLLLGVALAVGAILILVIMKTQSARIQKWVPDRFRQRYIDFEDGALKSFRRIPFVLALTIAAWLLEGGRLQLVFLSLGLHVHISNVPFAPMLFCALGTAVLTTIPFTPGGLGLVEMGLGALIVYLGVPKFDAAAVVLADRVVSYYSVAFLGFIVYLLSKRSHFRQTG